MSEETRNWRESRAPKRVIEATEAEMEALRLSAALSWPTEPEPEPVPFRWGDYDRLIGEPTPGVYWRIELSTVGIYLKEVEIARIEEGEFSSDGWRKWKFRSRGGDWTTRPERGALYRTKRDTCLAALWRECREAAKRLASIRAKLNEVTAPPSSD